MRHSASLSFNTLNLRQRGRHFADDIFKFDFVIGNDHILIKASVFFFLGARWQQINIKLVKKMAKRRTRDNALFDPMMAWFTDAYMRHSASDSFWIELRPYIASDHTMWSVRQSRLVFCKYAIMCQNNTESDPMVAASTDFGPALSRFSIFIRLIRRQDAFHGILPMVSQIDRFHWTCHDRKIIDHYRADVGSVTATALGQVKAKSN